MVQSSIEYFRERERAEREAALQAQSEGARAAHNRLADGYAVLVRRCLEEGEGDAPPPSKPTMVPPAGSSGPARG